MKKYLSYLKISQRKQKNNLFFNILKCFLVFITASSLFYYIQFNNNNPYLSQNDSYYHVKMAELIYNQGIPQNFPWLYFTILRDNFVDHQFLFHLFLIPFINIFGSILGAKIFEMIIFSLIFVFMYLILQLQQIKLPLLLTIFSLFTMSADFYYRINSIRDIGFSLLFMTVGIYALYKNKPLFLGILCFLYVWSYGGFIFLPILAIIYSIIQIISNKKWNWKMLLLACGGMILGLTINPYFPKNFSFLFSQIIQTGLGAKEYTGNEWRPYDTWYWVQTNYIPLIIFFFSIIISFIKNYKHSTKTVTIFVFTLMFLTLQWKSKRFVEYCPFFLTLSSFLILKPFLDEKIKELKNVPSFFKEWKNYFYVSTFIALIALSVKFASIQIARAREDTKTPFSMSALEKIHNYLKENSQKEEIVFTDDWDVFPQYFFNNTKNYYIVGLDPEFMNQYQGFPYEGEKEKLYQEFTAISSGNDSKNLKFIKEHFKASWIIVNTDHLAFYNNLKKESILFEEILFANNDPNIDHYPSALYDGYYLFKVL